MDHVGGEVLGLRSQINLDDVAIYGDLGCFRRAFSQSWISRLGESQGLPNRRGLYGLPKVDLDNRKNGVRGSTVGEGETSLNNLRPCTNGTKVLKNESMEFKCPLY
eukprot:Gb_11470 [translate_table: standard]